MPVNSPEDFLKIANWCENAENIGKMRTGLKLKLIYLLICKSPCSSPCYLIAGRKSVCKPLNLENCGNKVMKFGWVHWHNAISSCFQGGIMGKLKHSCVEWAQGVAALSSDVCCVTPCPLAGMEFSMMCGQKATVPQDNRYCRVKGTLENRTEVHYRKED